MDNDPPNVGTFTINTGAQYTNTQNVMLQLTCPDGALQVAFSNTTSTTNWQSCSSPKSHTLSAGDGLKTVYMRWRNNFGPSAYVTGEIFLDTTPPPVPALNVLPSHTASTSVTVERSMSVNDT